MLFLRGVVAARDEGATSSATPPPDGTFWTTATSFPRADAPTAGRLLARLVDGDLALSEAKPPRGETAPPEGDVRGFFGPTPCDACGVGTAVSVLAGFTTSAAVRARKGVDTRDTALSPWQCFADTGSVAGRLRADDGLCADDGLRVGVAWRVV